MSNVINLFAGPSAGKTTIAGTLFGIMKQKRMKVAYAPEFALELVADKDFETLDNQIYVFGEQHRRIYRYLNNVDYIITDSPLLLSAIYSRHAFKKFLPDQDYMHVFRSLVMYTFNKYNNANYFVDRGDRHYIQDGRVQNEQEAKEKDLEIIDILEYNNIPFKKILSEQDVIRDLGI